MRFFGIPMFTRGAVAALAATVVFGCGPDSGTTAADTAIAADTATVDGTATDAAVPDAAVPDAAAGDTTAADTVSTDTVPGDVVAGGVSIVAAEGGEVPLPDGLGRLLVPAGALGADTTITVELAPNRGAGGVGPAIVFGPSGTTFDPPATLELVVDDSGWDASLEVFGLAPTLVIDEGDHYESVLSLGAEGDGTEVYLVEHFSTFERTPGPSWGWQTDLAFPKACYELWGEAAEGGSPPAGAGQTFIGTCPQARAMVRQPTVEGNLFPPTGLGSVPVDFMGVLEWPDVAGGHMTVVPSDATSGTLNPSGQVALHWDVYIRFSYTDVRPSWCSGSRMKSAIDASLARAGGETERMLYGDVAATCDAPARTDYASGVAQSSYRVCRCLVEFAPFPWPNEPIPYTVSGTQLDLFGELFDFSVRPDANRWWMNVPVVSTLDLLAELPDTSEYAYAKMKLLISE